MYGVVLIQIQGAVGLGGEVQDSRRNALRSDWVRCAAANNSVWWRR